MCGLGEVDAAGARDVEVDVADVVHLHAYDSGAVAEDVHDAVDDGDEA